MTKEYLLSKTLYGADIIQHLIRKEFPDFVMRVSGTDCGQRPDPVWADGSIIEVTMDRIHVEGRRLPDYKARFHYPDGQLLDGDALALATAYYLPLIITSAGRISPKNSSSPVWRKNSTSRSPRSHTSTKKSRSSRKLRSRPSLLSRPVPG